MIDIRTFTNFYGFSNQEIYHVFQTQGVERVYRKGDLIYNSGDPANQLFYLHSGRVDACFFDENGNYFSTGVIDAPFFVGEDSFSIPPVRVCDCIAYTNCVIYSLNIQDLYNLCSKNPTLQREVYGLLAKKVLFLHCRIGAALQISSAKKIAYYLLVIYHAYGKNSDILSKEDIGSYVGVTRATASRTLNQFQRKGLIELNYSAIKILDIQGLIDICNEG